MFAAAQLIPLIENGRVFTITTGARRSVIPAFLRVSLFNPSDSRKRVVIWNINPSSGTAGWMGAWINPAKALPKRVILAQNMHSGHAREPAVVAKCDVVPVTKRIKGERKLFDRFVGDKDIPSFWTLRPGDLFAVELSFWGSASLQIYHAEIDE